MSGFGAVKTEGPADNPKIVSEPIDGNIKNKHLDSDDEFVFKALVIKSPNGKKFRIEVDETGKLKTKKKEK